MVEKQLRKKKITHRITTLYNFRQMNYRRKQVLNALHMGKFLFQCTRPTLFNFMQSTADKIK